MKIKIGTRASKLALWQAYHIQELLQEKEIETEIVEIITKGDTILDRSLSKIGSKGVFTEELEQQLIDGSIDIAVHSAKDLSSDLGSEFELIAFTEREESFDVFLADKKIDLQSSFVVGTSSTRRVAMLKRYYPQLRIVDIRGNLQTRIQKLKDGHCDVLLLAYAGVHRMGYDDMIVQKLPTDIFVPPVGQGCIAIETSKALPEDKKVAVRSAINNPHSEACLRAERAFLRKMNGGCSIPVFGNATLSESKINLRAGILSLDGRDIILKDGKGDIINPEELGNQLAENILSEGGDKILEEIKRNLNTV
ncbi:MAG: hydroxymethylbilane synthase [Leadbetterella sp.]